MKPNHIKKLLMRIVIKIVAGTSRLYTFLRHPILARSPDIFVKYYTENQKKALLVIQNDISDKLKSNNSHVLILIPFRDKWEMTRRCIDSVIENLSDRLAVTIVLIDNGSIESATKKGIDQLLKEENRVHFRHLYYDIPFNFSKLNNLAVAECTDLKPDYILCLNNDMEVLQFGFLDQLVDFANTCPNAGAVGCTLLYPNRRIQHLFVFAGCKIVGAHPFKGSRVSLTGTWFSSPQPVPAVTGACLLIKAECYQAVGGYDEKLANCYQDVDLCLKLQQMGRVNWVVPFVQMIHYETQTRRPISSWDEVSYIYSKWGHALSKNKYMSNRFSTWSEAVALQIFNVGLFPWQKIQS